MAIDSDVSSFYKGVNAHDPAGSFARGMRWMRAAISCSSTPPKSGFSVFVRLWSEQGELVVQPCTGFGRPSQMRAGLTAVCAADAVTVGTFPPDSFTRLGNFMSAERAMAIGGELNGYPLLAYSARTSRQMPAGISDEIFPVQVRHGTPMPQRVFRAILAAELLVTEGGPVSSSLLCGREPLASVPPTWAEARSILWADPASHIGVLGGCMLGQFCPQSLLIARSVLEVMILRQRGIMSVSLSYAQQTKAERDVKAFCALRLPADELLDDMDWHNVLYSFMGMFPNSLTGAARLSEVSVTIALAGGADRSTVKTQAEAHRISTIRGNIEALEAAHRQACALRRLGAVERSPRPVMAVVLTEARALIWSTLRLAEVIGEALREAFLRALLDVPFCLHPDNRNKSRPYLAGRGRLPWANAGSVPVRTRQNVIMLFPSFDLITMLSHNAKKYDAEAVDRLDGPRHQGTASRLMRAADAKKG